MGFAALYPSYGHWNDHDRNSRARRHDLRKGTARCAFARRSICQICEGLKKRSPICRRTRPASTPILHCSEAAGEPAHRRVLQVDFAAADLPGGLAWLGI
jgi:hypothetical protein